MCFRPAGVNEVPIECPVCGKRVNPTNGVYPSKCPFCKTVFPDLASSPSLGKPGAPSAPSVPNSFGASVSGVPKIPSTPAKAMPKAPKAPSPE